jgi:hypothetical protein
MLNKLGKLLKYEFRFYFRILPPLYLVLILVALVARLQGSVKTNASFQMGVPLLTIVWGALIVAMAVITITHIIQRFNDNFMKDQGSLMFTLPVTVWALIASKAIAAFCMVLMSFLSVAVSAVIFNVGSEYWNFYFMTRVNLLNINFAAMIPPILVMFIMILQQICLIYMVITASHILPRFRFPAACVMYLVIMNIMEHTMFRFVAANASVMHNGFLSVPAGSVALAFTALFFWVTGFLLKRSFDLE